MELALIPIKARWALTELVLMGLCFMLTATLNKRYKRNLDNGSFFLLVVLCCLFAYFLSTRAFEFFDIPGDWSWPKSFFVLLVTAVLAIFLNYIYVIKRLPLDETDGVGIRPGRQKMSSNKSNQTKKIEKPLPTVTRPPQVEGKKTLLKMRSPLNTAIAAVVSSVPDFILAWVLLQIWLYPFKNSSRGVQWALSLMLMEFIIIHSAGIMGGLIEQDVKRWKKIVLLFFLCSVYSVFAYLFGSWPALQGFWLLCLNRAMPVITGRVLSEDATKQATSNYATAGVLFLLSVIPSAIVWVPALGVTPEVIKKVGFTGDAPWNREPYRIMAAGVLYYTTFALCKLYPAIEIVRKNKLRSDYEA